VCGLIVRVSRGDAPAAPIARWLREIRHRGPDAAAAVGWSSPETLIFDRESDLSELPNILGFVRLSIIDLSDAADQPFVSPCGRYVIIYNGEIYNYVELREELAARGAVFATSSDTEVLVAAWAAWGKQSLERLEGMFAFVLFDRVENKLYAARDPFGIKPLYIAATGKEVLLCSEIGPLIERFDDRTYNRANAARILRWGFDEGSADTLVKDIERIPPGSCHSIDLRTLERCEECRFFDLDAIKQEDWSFEEARETLSRTFIRSVERHMRADVPISFSLSGGIDSSAIVCCAHALGLQRPRTFTYVPSDDAISELPWAELAIRRTGADASFIRPTRHDVVSNLPFVTRMQGEPFGTLSIFAQNEVYRAVRASGIKVILNGQGADELLAGYVHYVWLLFGGAVAGGHINAAFRLGRSLYSGLGLRVGELAKLAARSTLPRLLGEGAAQTYLERRAPWLDPSALREAGLATLVDYREEKGARESLQGALKHSLSNSLVALLRYDDRNSMSHSVESRVPFLTPAMARLCLSFPDEFLISRNGVTKHVFREAMRGIVPDEILDRRDKIGFAPDKQDWKHALVEVVAGLREGPAAGSLIDTVGLRKAIGRAALGDERFDFTLMSVSTIMLMFDRTFQMTA
jgi:asparagine synthase (glutamine-hydrolysing)